MKSTIQNILISIILLIPVNRLFASDNNTSHLFNASHLEHLQELVEVNGEECLCVRIYAEAPDYHYVVDDDEGSACVDDVARAARLHIERFIITKEEKHLLQAKGLLQYVLNMQSKDGSFYNFIWPDGSINKTHKNSIASLNWWSARSFRSLCMAYRYWPDNDQQFKTRLLTAINKTYEAVNSFDDFLVENTYDRYAVWLLAFNELKIATGSANYDQIITQLGQRIIDGKHNPSGNFPYTLHFSWENVWHGWGALQVEALARAGQTMNNNSWIRSAASEANEFHRWMLKNGFISAITINSEKIQTEDYSQIAYGINSLVQSQVALHEVTGDKTYLHQAGLFASWFNGNNNPAAQMYDPSSGRGYDGINNPDEVNVNAGAESTIEALLTIHLVDKYPEIKEAYFCKINSISDTSTIYESMNYTYELLKNEAEKRIDVKAKTKE